MQTYGLFYATSFLDLYRRPRQLSAASLSLTVAVDSEEQYLFLVSPPRPPRRRLWRQNAIFETSFSDSALALACRSEPRRPSWDPRLTSRW